MPLFKLSWQNPDINAAVVDLQPGVILLDFFAHEDPIRAIIETHSQMSLDFYAIDIPAISIPAIIPYFSIIESDSLEAVITVSLSPPIFNFFVTAYDDSDILASIAVSIKALPNFEVAVPDLNEARIFLALKTQLYFETYVPIICNFDIIVKVFASASLYHPTFALADVSMPTVGALFNTISENISFINLSLSPPELSFFCFVEQTLATLDISLSSIIVESRGVDVYASSDLDEEIIKFEYKLWMFKTLKAKHPELTDGDIIKFIEIGGLP